MINKSEKLATPFVVKAEQRNKVKQVDTSARTVDAIANTYYYIDSQADVLVPGCALKSIQDRGPNSEAPGKIKHLSNHDLDKGIGRIDVLEETKHEGMDVLFMSSFMSETALGEETLVKYNEGIIDQHSIGFRYMALEWIEEGAEGWDAMLKKLINPEDAEALGYMYLVSEIKLFEVSSLDGFGANRLTPYLGVKSDNVKVQYNNLIAKLDALHGAMKHGSKSKEIIEMQDLQIRQMIYELFHPEPSLKDTERPSGGATFDVSEAINNLNF